ncbi:MAG: hypothetical protein ACE5FU_00355, partial [Nitrospinota bacterium]
MLKRQCYPASKFRNYVNFGDVTKTGQGKGSFLTEFFANKDSRMGLPTNPQTVRTKSVRLVVFLLKVSKSW